MGATEGTSDDLEPPAGPFQGGARTLSGAQPDCEGLTARAWLRGHGCAGFQRGPACITTLVSRAHEGRARTMSIHQPQLRTCPRPIHTGKEWGGTVRDCTVADTCSAQATRPTPAVAKCTPWKQPEPAVPESDFSRALGQLSAVPSVLHVQRMVGDFGMYCLPDIVLHVQAGGIPCTVMYARWPSLPVARRSQSLRMSHPDRGRSRALPSSPPTCRCMPSARHASDRRACLQEESSSPRPSRTSRSVSTRTTCSQ